MLKAVLFDKDGVLIDTLPTYLKIAKEVFEYFGVDMTRELFINTWITGGKGTRFIIKKFNLTASLEEVRVKRNEVEQRLRKNITLKEHAAELVGLLKKNQKIMF